MEIIILVGVAVSVIVELLKKTPVPTEKPQLVVFIVCIGLVLGNAFYSGQLVQANIVPIVSAIVGIYASAIATFETVIKKLWI